ncbi:Uncharacterised protein [Vibrio cholerae]|uniref:Uncharacterized protein n=1 Tax=Vibrio cholerae TaxID=666 RepID=A0A655P0U7_VIBCL|nr:Uncharacterised protein [Vibrio cholerae]CSA17954.1 Uncharacterised protein [Vibrio cholerae]
MVLVLLLIFHTDVRQQTDQDRTVHRMVTARFIIELKTHFPSRLMQLGVHILPFTHAQIVEIVKLTLTAELVTGQRFLLLSDVVP